MVPPNRIRSRLALALAAAPLLTACAAPGVLRVVPVEPAVPAAQAATPALLPAGAAGTRRFVETTGGASLDGTVRFTAIDHPFFQDNGAAAYRALALPMPTARAFVTASTLDEEFYVKAGETVQATSDTTGAFQLAGSAPAGTPYLVNANLARGHRLSAIVPDGATTVTIDEVSSMIAETARWQMRPRPLATGHDPLEKTLLDLDATTLSAMTADARTLLDPATLAPQGGAVPDVAALKSGAGHVLRNLHVMGFGAQVTAAGATAADRLSDAWKALLGFRPLALTIVAGNGIRGYNQGDGRAATDASLLTPSDSVPDADGNLFIAEADGGRLRYVPRTAQPAWLGATSAMAAGNLYTLAGIVNGPKTSSAVSAAYSAWEIPSVADGKLAPLVADPDASKRPPLFSLQRLLVLEDGGKRHLLMTSLLGHRVQFIPDGNPGVNPLDPLDPAGPADVVNMFGRTFYAGRLYTVLGNGTAVGSGIYTSSGGETPMAAVTNLSTLANGARLNRPTGMAVDSFKNLYVMDSAHGYVRVLRQSDGKTFPLKFTLSGAAYAARGAMDLRIRNTSGTNYLYWTDTARHVVMRAPLPATLDPAPATVPVVAPIPAEPVLGASGQAGFIDVSQPSVYYPAVYDASDAIPESQALLSGPVSLDFDAAGNLLVADSARVRLLTAAGLTGAGEVLTLAGGLNTRYLSGDSRLAYLPESGYLNVDPVSGNVLLTDRKEHVVRRLFTARGAR